MEFSYRNALASDLDQISHIDQLAFGDLSYPRFFIRQAFDVFGGLLKVAEIEDGTIVGYTLGAISLDNPKSGWVLSVVVSLEYQRLGVGKHLTKRLISNLWDKKVIDIYLTVCPDNRNAISLYRYFGFVDYLFDRTYFGRNEPRIVMLLKRSHNNTN